MVLGDEFLDDAPRVVRSKGAGIARGEEGDADAWRRFVAMALVRGVAHAFTFRRTRTSSMRALGYWPRSSFSRGFTRSHTVRRAMDAATRASISTPVRQWART